MLVLVWDYASMSLYLFSLFKPSMSLTNQKWVFEGWVIVGWFSLLQCSHFLQKELSKDKSRTLPGPKPARDGGKTRTR